MPDAERYAQVTYSNLRDKKNGMDQDGEEVANGAHNLAAVIQRQDGDLIKAEELAREAFRIRTLIYGSDHNKIGVTCELLARILRLQNKLGDETRGLFERSLAIDIRNEGGDSYNVATGHINIGKFYYKVAEIQSTIDSKKMQLQLAKFHTEESLRIFSKIYGPTHER